MADTERTKQVEALRRAMSVNRMIDYGMTRPLAERAHREVLEGKSWDTCLEALADEEIEHAHAAEVNGRSEAAPHWRAATASLIFAQMTFNFDTDRKRNLYARVTSCFAEHAARSRLSIAKVQTSFR